MGLAKSWIIREEMSLKLAWEVFNVTNSVRFDTNTNTSLDDGSDDGSFGRSACTAEPSQCRECSSSSRCDLVSDIAERRR